MPKNFTLMLRLGLLLLVSAALLSGGCTTVRKWAGYETVDEDEETVPPEAQQETVEDFPLTSRSRTAMQMVLSPGQSFFPGSQPISLVVKYRLVSMRPCPPSTVSKVSKGPWAGS